ncbi:hypothetical protein BS17DRAFT_358817 [Gyrodon lividus]|nr:hypothetical protein BS17DRAFT_358817 [Gyrodon lividus]
MKRTTRFSVVLQTSLFTMRFTLATVITALPFFIAAAARPAKQRGTAVPLSKLSWPVNADKSVNFETLNSHIAATTAKILGGVDNFEKNIGALHPSAVNGAWKRDASRLPLVLLPDPLHRWFGTISIGTPPRNFAGTLALTLQRMCSSLILTVLFDTGSGHVFLIWCTYDGNFTLNFIAATLFCQVLSVTTPAMTTPFTILKHL